MKTFLVMLQAGGVGFNLACGNWVMVVMLLSSLTATVSLIVD